MLRVGQGGDAMSAKHTPGLVSAGVSKFFGSDVFSVASAENTKKIIAITGFCGAPDEAESIANTERIKAFWNECNGLDNYQLARFGLGTATGSEIHRLREQNAELVDLLKEALSVCSSVSISQDRKVVVDGCVSYRQTEEWCKWLEQEVEPKIRAAIAKTTGCTT
jgi:hypothetical protein